MFDHKTSGQGYMLFDCLIAICLTEVERQLEKASFSGEITSGIFAQSLVFTNSTYRNILYGASVAMRVTSTSSKGECTMVFLDQEFKAILALLPVT